MCNATIKIFIKISYLYKNTYRILRVSIEKSRNIYRTYTFLLNPYLEILCGIFFGGKWKDEKLYAVDVKNMVTKFQTLLLLVDQRNSCADYAT